MGQTFWTGVGHGILNLFLDLAVRIKVQEKTNKYYVIEKAIDVEVEAGTSITVASASVASASTTLTVAKVTVSHPDSTCISKDQSKVAMIVTVTQVILFLITYT